MFFVIKLVFAHHNSFRVALIKGATLFGLTVVALTEGLSLLSYLTRPIVICAWLLVVIILYILIPKKNTHYNYQRLPLLQPIYFLFLGIILIFAGTLLIALWAAPNNWDSMTYHLARVVHWQQQGSVSFFATSNLAELQPPPFAEYLILHLHMLSNSDRFDGIVQWLSLLGSVISVSLIAKEFGASLRAQVIAAVFACTLPMAVLQASSTQNDLVASLWLTTSMYFTFRLLHNPNKMSAFYLGASFGLALLTKGTNYIYLAPAVIWIGYVLIWRLRRRGLMLGLMATCIIISINLPHLARNTSLFGDPFGIGQSGIKITNSNFSHSSLVSNMLRNFMLHVPFPSGPAQSIAEEVMSRGFKKLHIDPSDPDTTWPGTTFKIAGLSYHEDRAGNPLHIALIIITFLFLFIQPKNKICRYYLMYALCIFSAYILFCLFFKWQPWNSRLHLPLFILCAPLVAITLETDKGAIGIAIAIVLIIASIPWLLCNDTRPLVTHYTTHVNKSILLTKREDQYYNTRPYVRRGYQKVLHDIKKYGYNKIGLILACDTFKYPLFLPVENIHSMRYEHLNVVNESCKYQDIGYVPEAVVYIKNMNGNTFSVNGSFLSVKDRRYQKLWSVFPVSFWVRSDLYTE